MIEVHGATGATGVDLGNAGGSLINEGEIIVSVSPGSDGVAIGYYNDGFGTLTNSGLLSADVAVLFQTRYGETFTINNSGTIEGAIVWNLWDPTYTFGRLNLTNSGTMVGSIIADPTSTGIETIVNTGQIIGDLILAGGNDKYDGTNGELVGIVDAGAGNDIVIGWFDNDTFCGGDGNDTLTGNGGDDFLEGGAGHDTLNGGAGFDIAAYTEATAGVTVSLAIAGAQSTGGAGTDTLSGIEDLAGSEYGDQLTGSASGNYLFGGGGNDTLDGGLGADHLIGGLGDDIFIVDNAGDVISEYAGEGTDEVRTSLAYVLGANLENLLLTGAEAIDGAGNGFDNVVAGNDAANQLSGLAGADRLIGNAGNDTLDGGTGADKLFGGAGDDTYIVDHASDIVVEYAGEGTDTVHASVNHTLRDNVENIVLTGIYSIYANGNALANQMTGNSGSNKLYGLAGDDLLIGNDGNDTLDGGTGADQMIGGAGNEQYYVDNVGDQTIELAGEGIDTVRATINVALAANIENVVLLGTANLTATGNELNNVMTGNAGANHFVGGAGVDQLKGLGGNDTLDGGLGSDRLYGGTGDDTYVVDTSGDLIFENSGEGVDTVISSGTHILAANVEHLILTGSANISGTGNGQDNQISGNSGANILYGGLGNDLLMGDGGADVLKGEDGNDALYGGAARDRFYGGAGADKFAFADGDFAGLTSSTCDQIHDFSTIDGDYIDLGSVDADTGQAGDQAFAFIGTGAFTGTAGELRTYQSSGQTYLQGDTNGDGAADFMIRLDGLHTLGGSDFAL